MYIYMNKYICGVKYVAKSNCWLVSICISCLKNINEFNNEICKRNITWLKTSSEITHSNESDIWGRIVLACWSLELIFGVRSRYFDQYYSVLHDFGIWLLIRMVSYPKRSSVQNYNFQPDLDFAVYDIIDTLLGSFLCIIVSRLW